MLVESKDVHLNREEGSSPCKANIRADDAKRALKELVEFEQEESREQLQRVKAILSAIEAVNASLAELANPVNPGNVNALPEHIVQPARALQKALPLLVQARLSRRAIFPSDRLPRRTTWIRRPA
jgi:hypothetical protein